MKLNKQQKRRINRAVKLAEWSLRQKRANVLNEDKTPCSALRATFVRG